jgi:hypothetical protein
MTVEQILMSKPQKREVEVGDLTAGIAQAPLAGAPSS